MPPSDSSSGPRSWRGVLAVALGLGAGAGLLLLPWWRNHSLLRDFYDYGLVIAAAGRMALGELPYVDFTTPIQTLHFLQAQAAEKLFGPHYLSLTYANAGFIVAAFVALAAVLRRPLGWAVALLVAAAVVAASAGQHTIVWHNAMGVIWTALVVWLTAPRRPARVGRLAGVVALLWIGGMTKLNYQATALAFAGLFALRDGWSGLSSWRRVALTLAAYGAGGLVAPVATEMAYTGATFAQWWENVVVTPGGRVGLLHALAQPGFYLHTPHDYYHPLYLPFVGAWGLAVLAAVAVPAVQRLRRDAAPRGSRVLLSAALIGAAVCGGVLQATNFDIAYVAGAAWLALAVGVALAWLGDADGRVGGAGRMAVALAAVTLLGPAWQAAWNGTRALWDHSTEDRAALVTAGDLPERYGYFHGMRITRELHDSLVLFDRLYVDLHNRGQTTGEFYFVNGTEFMLRAYPGKRYHGLPLWLHEGTTYTEKGARQIQEKLAADDIRGVVSHGGWNEWRHGTEWYLNARFQYERVGGQLHVYRQRGDARRNWRDATTFASFTASTAFVPDLVASGGPFTLCRAASGPGYLGTPRSARLGFRQPVDALRGELVARRAPAAGGSPLDMVWRVVTTEPDGSTKVWRDERIVLAPDEAERVVPVAADVGGRPATLELYLPPDERIEAGFRRLQAVYPAGAVANRPNLLEEDLPVQAHAETWPKALFADESLWNAPCEGVGFGTNPNETAEGPQLFVHTPGIVWFKVDRKLRRLAGEYGLGEVTWTNRDALNGVRAQVVFFRPGHLQVLVDRELRPREREADRPPQPFEVELPGQDGWVGLVFTALDNPRNSYGHSWWRRLRAW